MKKLKWIAGGLLILANVVNGAGLQPGAALTPDSFSSINLTPVQAEPILMSATDVSSLRSLSDAQLTTLVDALDATPTIAFDSLPRKGISGTFYSLQHPNWPPLPANTSHSPVWQMTDFYLLNDVNFDYAAQAKPRTAVRIMAMGISGLPGFGGGGTNTLTFNSSSSTLPDYGTNLWIAQVGFLTGNLVGIITNSEADVLYEIQSKQDLLQSNWVSEGFLNGSEITNWTDLAVTQGNRTNLFLRIRSWLDSNNSGIPDWWWLQYFGQTTNVDTTVSAAGDGYSNLQKFQMGLNPTNYYNPNPPGVFFGCLDASGTNAFLEWSPAPGPVINYAIQRGIQNTNGNYVYSQIGLVSSNATFFKDAGAITNANAQNNIYNLQAVYPGGSLSATDSWQVSWYASLGSYGPPYGPPMPGNVYAYAKSTGTNVLISWTRAQGALTNYSVLRGIFDTNINDYVYSTIAGLNTNTTSLQDVGGIKSANDWNNIYEVEAVYAGGGVSQPAAGSINTNPPPPTELAATLDSTGTNVQLSWNPPQGITVTNYIIMRGIYDTNTGSFSYSQIGQVNAGTISFEDVGAITGNNSYNNSYEVEAIYPGGGVSQYDSYYLSGPPSPPAVFNDNIYITACLIRNGTGRWQVMFSGYPSNSAQAIKLIWTDPNNNATTQIISTTNLFKGIYSIADTNVVNLLGNSLTVQLFGPFGEPGQTAQAGVLANDAPYFVDGRRHMKQNLNFMIRGASQTLPFFAEITEFREFFFGGFGLFYDPLVGEMNQSSTNFEEFSFLHHGSWNAGGYEDLSSFQLDSLWPFTVNYNLANYFVDTARTNLILYGSTNFIFQPNFATNVPAPAILTHIDPYWILQPGFVPDYTYYNMAVPTPTNWAVTVTSTQTVATLAIGSHNLFGLPYQTGCAVDMDNYYYGLGAHSLYQSLAPGNSVTANSGYIIGDYANWCPAPTLQLTNYYFVPIFNPNLNPMGLPGAYVNYYAINRGIQPLTPLEDDFNPTNQTPPLIIGTVGQPVIIASWGKYAISNTSPTKYAYLGQYFTTNAFLLNSSGAATTNSAGIVSPYGEFFPMQAGVASLVTMPDIDTGVQGTSVVRVVSLNADANHDGTIDFSYTGPDQNSSSRPFRFWVNDNQDAGDTGGDGIPGLGVEADGVLQMQTPVAVPYQSFPTYYANGWEVHGRRDLADFFPVYLNIGSLFQSNALSAGINITDTNYQFILSQADGALRFAYTSLTPTNYMNFLLNTNMSGSLASALLTTITNVVNGGVPLAQPFVSGIATNSQGIILVEGWKGTTQPLVLSIYHGTNQIAKTSLYLSISGVEQMFRSKTMMLNSQPGMVADRLTDADVPNECDTINKNFVFLHGYNVLPNEARGVAADMFKRMYWSGSHAKFYAVTWEGADTKGTLPFEYLLTPNYHTNVVNAFGTAPMLANFIASLTNSGPVVTAAHSLGNMVTLSAISDWNAPISQYFMLDAAVPIEAIDPTATTNMMTFSTWTAYSNRVFASSWYKLFSTNDARSTLFWNNRLGNLRNVDVYNFYSSGEEVLRTSAGDPPPSVLGKVFTQVTDFWSGIPFGTYTWYWQEKGKGTCSQDWFLGSSHGGWRFPVNSYGDPNPVPSGTANSLSNAVLQVAPIFTFGSYFDQISGRFQDLTLTNAANGSTYAATYRNRLLADAIPAMSLVAGANPVPSFDNNHNKDMMTLENGWSLGRTVPENNKWHHSDFVQMAYTFTYNLFNQFVTTGNLK